MARRRASEWRRLVSEWERSGLEAQEFARRHGLTAKRLRWWRWRIRATADGATSVARPERVVGDGQADEVPVALVRVIPVAGEERGTEGETPIELVVGDVLVRVRSGFDCVALGHVLDVLEGQEGGSC